MSKSDRSKIAQIAAHTRWAQTQDRTAATAKARQAASERFERQVDPEGVLSIPERKKRAENARQAYFMQLARKSAKARAR
jgi:hypothetical protein